MILFNVILDNEQEVEAIGRFLIDHQLALNIHIDTNRIFQNGAESNTVRIFFITRALLYDRISKEIKARFNSANMFFYATPVTHVSDELASRIRENVIKAD